MGTFCCPKQHESSEPDYCSECGARIEGAAAAVPATNGAKVANGANGVLAEHCPECGAGREQKDVVFCEICGYNFETGAHGEVPMMPVAAVSAAPVVEAEDALPAAPVSATANHWAVEVSVDVAAREAGSPDPPADFVASTVELKTGASLVGRKSSARAIHPEVDLSYDTAVSHRHALIEVMPTGSAFLRDIGASNGTKLNGRQIEPLKDHPLAGGDVVTLGHWSRLVMKAVD